MKFGYSDETFTFIAQIHKSIMLAGKIRRVSTLQYSEEMKLDLLNTYKAEVTRLRREWLAPPGLSNADKEFIHKGVNGLLALLEHTIDKHNLTQVQ